MNPSNTRATLISALVLALGAAVSLGLARFCYALLLPPMRVDLGWSYLTAGLMNTVNAAGYLVGALAMPWLLRRFGARVCLVYGSLGVAVLMALHGCTRSNEWLMVLRLATGVGSAMVFVSGGLLAARLATQVMSPAGSATGLSAGLVLGIFYGGTGLGIVVSSLLVPAWTESNWLLSHAPFPGLLGWQGAWVALALAALMATAIMAWRVAPDAASAAQGSTSLRPAIWRQFRWALAGYFMFGLGYIGYMTFIVTLLREQQLSTLSIVSFYCLLGLGVMVSPWLWARLLQRQRGGAALGLLNALLALAVALPVWLTHPLAAFASGALFGSVFLSVVASTTALVRHNLPAADWPAGISAFTIVFAFGQIVGPGLVGQLADAAGGLRAGLAVSAGGLLLGAALAGLQQPLSSSED